MVICLPRIPASKALHNYRLWENTAQLVSLKLQDATIHSYDTCLPVPSAHRNQLHLKPRKYGLDCKISLNEANITHGVPDAITQRTTTAEHSIFDVPPVEPRYASTRRVERARAMMHEVMGCFS